MTHSVPHAEPFVSAVPKLLDVVNVPVAYSFDYACQLITIPARQTRDEVDERGTAQPGTNVQTQGIIAGPPTALINSRSQDISRSTSALSPVIEILLH